MSNSGFWLLSWYIFPVFHPYLLCLYKLPEYHSLYRCVHVYDSNCLQTILIFENLVDSYWCIIFYVKSVLGKVSSFAVIKSRSEQRKPVLLWLLIFAYICSFSTNTNYRCFMFTCLLGITDFFWRAITCTCTLLLYF